jgi:hypothetical protein
MFHTVKKSLCKVNVLFKKTELLYFQFIISTEIYANLITSTATLYTLERFGGLRNKHVTQEQIYVTQNPVKVNDHLNPDGKWQSKLGAGVITVSL